MDNGVHFLNMTNWVGYNPSYNFLKEREATMNKIYKVVWSKVRNCYVVVSELAKRNGKCKAAKTDSLNTSSRICQIAWRKIFSRGFDGKNLCDEFSRRLYRGTFFKTVGKPVRC